MEVLAGTVVGFYISELSVEVRHISQVVDIGKWYGKVQYNAYSGKVYSQEYYGFKKTSSVVVQDLIQRRLIVTATGQVLYIATGQAIWRNPYINYSLPKRLN